MTRETKKILVATDFSEGSDQVLERALDLGKPTGATVAHLVLTVPSPKKAA